MATSEPQPSSASNAADYSTFESLIPVRPDDIDLNGHVHHPKYLDYVLAARFDQMERCYHMSMQTFLDRGLTWFVKSACIEHKRPLFLGQTARVRTHIARIEDKEVRVDYEILIDETGKLSAAGHYQYTLVDPQSGRSVSIPEDIVKAYSV